MYFGIGLTISPEAQHKAQLIHNIDNALKADQLLKNYGEGLIAFSIDMKVVNPPPGFEHLFKVLPPKYVLEKTSKNPYTGELVVTKKHFFCTSLINGAPYELFLAGTEAESQKIIIQKIIESLDNLE